MLNGIDTAIHDVEVLVLKCVKPVEPVFEKLCIGLLVTHNVSIYPAMFDAYTSIPRISWSILNTLDILWPPCIGLVTERKHNLVHMRIVSI